MRLLLGPEVFSDVCVTLQLFLGLEKASCFSFQEKGSLGVGRGHTVGGVEKKEEARRPCPSHNEMNCPSVY
jgi:hypothetical protein